MKLKNKSLRTALLTLFLTFVAAATGALFSLHTALRTAPASAESGHGYYFNQLNEDAKKFYNAIADMDEQGLLKQGDAKYDLVANDVVTQSQLESFSRSQAVTESFGAARDAYSLDHPEIFYVDFSYLSISVGLKDGEYVASLGTGRADSYYLPGGFASQSEVAAAVTAYDAALKEITDGANAFEAAADKVKSVNESLVERIAYSFCTTAEEAAYAPHIRSAYGALVNGKAVCEGFARAFKCAMDELEIPCVIVQGYATDEGGIEPHAWNYVKLDGSWYGVDVTWNNGTGKAESYLLRGANIMDKEHIADGVVSAANFEFEYPLLSPGDYGSTGEEAITVGIESEDDGTIVYRVGKDGMNSTQLAQKGLWLLCRYYFEQGDGFTWSAWISVKKTLDSMGMPDGNGYSPTSINPNVMYVQFAITDSAPGQFGTYGSDVNLIVTSKYYENEGYGASYGAPYVKETSPVHTAANLDATKTYDIEITYTQNLKKTDESADVGIQVSTVNADAVKYMEISDISWNGTDKITFKFTPSAMYQHRDEVYTFTPTNVVGVQSNKAPMSVMYITKNNNVACNRVYPDGRLYVNTYGQPALVGTGDLSLTGWKDGDGNPVSENQRSQLMLVATKTTEKEGKEMIGHTDLPEGAVKAAETFEIELNLCKNIVRIPNGSTVQVAFGFPAGYGPDDEGVTFKVYHFKRGADGKIDYTKTEEVECVITEYGLMVNVSDFSPFAVVAVDKAQVQDLKKSVYARSVGFGGTFEGEIAQLVDDGRSVTYTLRPEEGYRVARVTLNGDEIEVDGNAVTLSYDELGARNTVEFYYVADSVASYEAENGIAVVYPGRPAAPAPADAGDGKLPAPTVVIAVVALVVAILAAGVLTVVIVKHKQTEK